MEDCIFCKIVNGEIPCHKIYEDNKTLAFLDISPASPRGGHTLVLPKKHYELIENIPDSELADLMKSVKKVSKALLKYSEGLNIIQNNKKIAGQYIPHIHFHLVPRQQNDGIIIEKWKVHKYKDGDIEKVASKIKSLLK